MVDVGGSRPGVTALFSEALANTVFLDALGAAFEGRMAPRQFCRDRAMSIEMLDRVIAWLSADLKRSDADVLQTVH